MGHISIKYKYKFIGDRLNMNNYTKNKFDLNTIFKFDDQIMKIMNIDPVKIINNIPEVWKYTKFDRDEELTKSRMYFVSNYGRLYNIKMKKIISGKKSNYFKSSKGGYVIVSISRLGKNDAHYLMHRLVAMSFLEEDKERPFVNHIDGIPSHNYLWNLEWVNASENSQHAVKTGLINQPKGEKRKNAIWTDNEIHLVCKLISEGHKATFIYHVLGDLLNDSKVKYERVRTLYKHIIKQTHWTHISKKYDIDFSRYNYSKEKGSRLKYQNKHNKTKLPSGEYKPL